MWNIFSHKWFFKTGILKVYENNQLTERAILGILQKIVPKTLQNSWETPVLVSFLLGSFVTCSFLKNNFSTDMFLWILQNV